MVGGGCGGCGGRDKACNIDASHEREPQCKHDSSITARMVPSARARAQFYEEEDQNEFKIQVPSGAAAGACDLTGSTSKQHISLGRMPKSETDHTP